MSARIALPPGTSTCFILNETFLCIPAVVCKARIETEDSTSVNCTVGWRVTCARVFPDLNLTAGVFDPTENKFIDRVTEWTKVVYSDNTYGYNAFKSYHVSA